VPIIALALAPTLLHWPALLLPVHIVLMELLIDPACSIVFEAEPEAPDIMQRPPRAVADSPFALRALWPALLQGAGVAALLLGAQAWLQAQGWSMAEGRTVVFGALVLCVLLLILAQRDGRVPGRGGAPNPWLLPMAAAVGLLLAALLVIPGLGPLMGLRNPGLPGLAAGAAVLLPCLAWLELLRQLRLRLARRRRAE
jgi:Ca2+-transporting ATPase